MQSASICMWWADTKWDHTCCSMQSQYHGAAFVLLLVREGGGGCGGGSVGVRGCAGV